MLERLKSAAVDGIVLGVKWALVGLLALFALSWALGDYGILRQRAMNGQRAFEFIQQQVEAAKSQRQPSEPVR